MPKYAAFTCFVIYKTFGFTDSKSSTTEKNILILAIIKGLSCKSYLIINLFVMLLGRPLYAMFAFSFLFMPHLR